MSTILILAKLVDGTGNKTTAERIRKYLDGDRKSECAICNISDFDSKEQFHAYVIDNDVKVIVGIHALRAGRLIQGLMTPYVMIFGGTDVHCGGWNAEEKKIMQDVVKSAKYLVAFSNTMKESALTIWPFLQEPNIIQQSQGVITGPCSYSYRELFQDHNKELDGDFETKNFFLFVGGIRKVKDPLFLMNLMSEWNQMDNSVMLVIIGPELDTECTAKCKQRLASLHGGVHMFPGISFRKIHALLQQSVALVNTSLNEGMAGAILEAMHLGIPVIARKNKGNASIVTDMENGMLFETPEEFKSKAMKLLQCSSLREQLARNGQYYVEQHHNAEDEKVTYQKIVTSLLPSLTFNGP